MFAAKTSCSLMKSHHVHSKWSLESILNHLIVKGSNKSMKRVFGLPPTPRPGSFLFLALPKLSNLSEFHYFIFEKRIIIPTSRNQACEALVFGRTLLTLLTLLRILPSAASSRRSLPVWNFLLSAPPYHSFILHLTSHFLEHVIITYVSEHFS